MFMVLKYLSNVLIDLPFGEVLVRTPSLLGGVVVCPVGRESEFKLR